MHIKVIFLVIRKWLSFSCKASLSFLLSRAPQYSTTALMQIGNWWSVERAGGRLLARVLTFPLTLFIYLIVFFFFVVFIRYCFCCCCCWFSFVNPIKINDMSWLDHRAKMSASLSVWKNLSRALSHILNSISLFLFFFSRTSLFFSLHFFDCTASLFPFFLALREEHTWNKYTQYSLCVTQFPSHTFEKEENNN